MNQIERRVRVAGGKSLVLKVDCEGGQVKGLRLRGDFFFYPEEGLSKLESYLLSSEVWKLDDPGTAISRFMKESGYQASGFAPDDLAFLLRGLRC